MDSDINWEKFLPSDLTEIVSGSVSPHTFSSKKKLFFRLCNPVIIYGGKWFSEVAVLRTTDWLEIEGKVKTAKLEPNTKNGLLKIVDRAYGFDAETAEVSVEVGDDYKSIGKACLGQRESKQERSSSTLKMVKPNGKDHEQIPCGRGDGLVEIELGEFFSSENCQEK